MYFSIIIPTLNEEKSITACLTALQIYRNDDCELILVDGGSVDSTKKLAKFLVDKIVDCETGRAAQMNAGARQASGEILIFLHADTLLPPNALDLIARSLDQNKRWGRFDIQLDGTHRLLKTVAWFMNWRSRLTGIVTGDQVIFLEKSFFFDMGQYPVLPLMEDIALSAKLKKISPPVCLKARVISSGRRWEQFGVIKTILLMWGLRLRYFFGADPKTLAYLYNKGLFWKI
jgi:rSAM/selenodomain-associated transferase 2